MAAKLILALRRRYNLSVLDTKGMNLEYGSISPCLGTQRSLLSYQRKSSQTSASGSQLSPKIAACANFLLEETELDPRHSVGFHWLFIVWTLSWATHFNWPWLEQRDWTRWALQDPSNLSQTVILWFICFLFSDSYSNARKVLVLLTGRANELFQHHLPTSSVDLDVHWLPSEVYARCPCFGTRHYRPKVESEQRRKKSEDIAFICGVFQAGALIYSHPCVFYKIQRCFYCTKSHNKIYQPVSYMSAWKIEL